MRKRNVFLLLALSFAMLAGVLTGCGKANENSGKTADGKTVLEFWTFTGIHGDFYLKMAEKWNAANPDKQIQVNVNVMPYDDMHNKLQIALNSGKGTPDFMDIEQGKFANFTQGTPALMDLSDVARPYTESGNIVKSRLDLYSKNGALYGLPTHVGATVAFYNTELLSAAGIDYKAIVTWDDFKEAGREYNGKTGKYLSTADTSALWTENLLMAELGGEYTDENGNVTVNSPEMLEAMTILKDLFDAKAIGTVPGGNPDREEAFGAFNSGEFVCAIMPLWQMSRYTSYMPDLKGKIAIAVAPQMEKGRKVSVGGGGTGTAVVAGKENASLSAEFLAYAKLSDEGGVEVWNMLGFDPCNMRIWDDVQVTNNPENQFIQYFQNNPFDVLKEIKNNIVGLESHASASYPSINNMFTTVTLNSIFESGTDVKTALDQAQADLKNELGQ